MKEAPLYLKAQRNHRNNSSLMRPINSNLNICLANNSFDFHSFHSIDNTTSKKYFNINKNSCRIVKINQCQSFISTRSSSFIQRKKKSPGTKFSKEDKEEIHEKAEEYIKLLLQKPKNNISKEHVDLLQQSKNEKFLISYNHMKTRILKESNDCLLHKSRNQDNFLGYNELREYNMKLLKKHFENERKYSTVNLIQDEEKNKQIPQLKEINEEFKICSSSNYNANMNHNQKSHSNQKNIYKIRLKLEPNQSIPKTFIKKHQIDDVINKHIKILNQIGNPALPNIRVKRNGKLFRQERIYLKLL